ncbi:serine/threonine protein kinase [Streptomyces hygroscopicus]|uniref:serine/threonine-protein kinase n=1 Tax=Streptomyces hygroscopicus TaxID=1912 RepID=UPI002240C7A3|nr:serine/threonine protein kinase [Streptomyces hygroscopicus]MCW7941848.1 serine/threonine protein kinase [Streptomyces hygroscopicus]
MGEVFAGRYELVDPVGSGGVGAVWRAWDHRRRRYVAAKVLQQSDAHALLRFVREQALRIDHPHVLAPASWAADDDKVLFTMDLVAGGSLVHLVGDYGPLPPAFVCTLLDQLLSGLAAVHAEGVVHRDIKPANVLLEATGTARPRLRLSDFGIAMRLGEPRLTETDYVVGTPGYISPEQLLGAEPDFPGDLFAVGLVALYLLEGAKPDTRALVEHFVANGTPGAPRGIPGPLWEVVATLLQPDPAARFRTATGARKALATAMELLPEPGPDDEQVEIFDQLGPLPAGFGPQGPLRRASGSAKGSPPAPPHASGTTTGRAGATQSAARMGADWSGTGRSDADRSDADRSGAGRSDAESPGPPAAAPASPGTAPPRQGAAPRPPLPDTPHTGGGPARPSAGPVPPRPTTAPTASGASAAAADAPRTPAATPGTPPPAVRPGAAPPVVPPMPSVDPTPPPPPSPMSDTGSFHLPPPLPQEPVHTVRRPPERPPTPPGTAKPPAPAHTAPTAPAWLHHPAHIPLPAPDPHPAPTAAVRQSTHAYVVGSPHAPTRPQGIARHGRRAAVRRPGPPAKVAVPVLLLALVCFAVGFWALTRI